MVIIPQVTDVVESDKYDYNKYDDVVFATAEDVVFATVEDVGNNKEGDKNMSLKGANLLERQVSPIVS